MKTLLLFVIPLLLGSCNNQTQETDSTFITKSKQTLDSLYQHFGVSESNLLRETFPYDDQHKATYLASESAADTPNAYSYLWPYSGTLSAVTALLESTKENQYKELLDNKVLPGLECYFDTEREPAGYASYIQGAPTSDRFYDDNVWLGIDFTDIYRLTKEQPYLDKAKLIWDFVISGHDDLLEGGIYWCEQRKNGKNTCSNAPGAVFALKLYEATKDKYYLDWGIKLYNWTKTYLQDPSDFLFYDNINLNGATDKKKYAYNSGQMIQAASLLYKITKEKNYLEDAQNIASASYNFFFEEYSKTNNQQNYKIIKNGDIWFTAVMLRGFVELYTLDKNAVYINSFKENLTNAWTDMRESNGLFNTDWKGIKKDEKKWLLTQGAMVEMYARLANY
ncbi:MAG: glycoside hydrolase family 76 protein [Bacteroides sp.]|nr:glycoside hydrolase family 76 protein [Bacteroides sp.]